MCIRDRFDITVLENASTIATGGNTADNNAVGNSKNHIQFNNITDFSGGTAMFRINQNALPVELSKFQVIGEGCNVRLIWVSESELNFAYYEVQRSVDGVAFETITRIDGKGTGSTQSYSFIDAETDDLNYYRLKMVDLDGTTKYSTIENVTINCGDEKTLTIYPNPIDAEADLLNVKFYSNRNDIRLVITDMLGRRVKIISLEVEKEWNTVSIDISNLPAGTYHLQQTGNDSHQKFVVKD